MLLAQLLPPATEIIAMDWRLPSQETRIYDPCLRHRQ